MEVIRGNIQLYRETVCCGVLLIDSVGKGGDRSAVRQINLKNTVAKNTILIVHGVDVTLSGNGLQGFIGFLIGEDGIVLQIKVSGVFRHQLRSEVGHRSGNHIAIFPGSLGQPIIQIRVRLSGVEHINANSGGTILRIGIQSLDGHRHHIPAPGLIGTDIFHGPVIDAHNKNVAIQSLSGLIQTVGKHLIRAVENAKGCRRGKASGTQQRNKSFFPGIQSHTVSFSSGSPARGGICALDAGSGAASCVDRQGSGISAGIADDAAVVDAAIVGDAGGAICGILIVHRPAVVDGAIIGYAGSAVCGALIVHRSAVIDDTAIEKCSKILKIGIVPDLDGPVVGDASIADERTGNRNVYTCLKTQRLVGVDADCTGNENSCAAVYCDSDTCIGVKQLF